MKIHQLVSISVLCRCSFVPLALAFGFVVPSALAQNNEPDDAAAELASFQVADGFEVSLFASEKDGVVKPIQIRFDPRGRLWVIGSAVYPQIEPGQSPNDKVLILEDTNGDGRCDKTTVFADGLMIPTGLELGDGGAYVGHGTELLFLKDNDSDGKADQRRVVLRGFGTGDNHQNINSFLFGPGGELWFSQGLHIRSRVESPWGITRLDQAGIWRLWPRRLKLEGFYGSEHEPQNPWGFVFTDWSEPIVIAGNNSSTIYPVPGLVVNHRDDPPPLIWKNGNGRKSSGGDIVGTTHFPDAWQGVLILGGYINNAVWALKISDDDAGFSLEDLPPLIKSTSRSFRPVDAKFGPDGALYICDWYNPIIGHYQASFRHPDRDKTHGRIWRVTAKNRLLTKPPRLVDASIGDLLEHLKSPDRWTRRFAKRVLADRPREAVTMALKEWTARPGLSEHALVEALGVYQSHEVVAPELLARLCRATNWNARAYAASVVGAWADRLVDPLALLRPLVADENPRVRLQAVVACTYVARPEAMEVAAVAADFPSDKFLTYALNQAVFALKPYWLAPFKAGKLKLENKPARLSLLIRADGTPDTLNALRELVDSPITSGAQRENFLMLLAEVGDANDLARLLDAKTFSTSAGYEVAQHARVLETLALAARARNIHPAGDPSAALKALLEKNSNDTLRIAVLHLATQWKLPALNFTALYAFACTPDNEELRIAGATALAVLWPAEAPKLLASMAGGRVAAAIGFISLDLPHAAAIAADILSTDSSGRSVATLLPPFLQRQGGTAALAAALAAKPPTRDAAKLTMRLLNAAGRQDQQLTAVLVSAAGFSSEPKRLTPEETTALSAEVRANGNAKRGAEIFRRAELGCIACHTVNGTGGNIGPDLSALGTAQPIDFIIGAILEPQKEIKEGFMSLSVITKDGEEYQGYPVRETSDELMLRDVLQNKEVRLRRDTIKERKQNGSVMPAGLADTLPAKSSAILFVSFPSWANQSSVRIVTGVTGRSLCGGQRFNCHCINLHVSFWTNNFLRSKVRHRKKTQAVHCDLITIRQHWCAPLTMPAKFTMPLLLVILCAGCSTHMLRNGLAIHTTPVGASQMLGYAEPVATKTTSGDIVFEYDVRVEQYGIMGYWHGPHKVLARLRLTNMVSSTTLRPATNFWRLGAVTADCPVATMDSDFTTPSQLMPLLERQFDEQGRSTLPKRECVMWAGDWVWYVPPRRDGDVPLASVLSKETTTTPGYAYPVRIILFPVVLVGDILFWPTFWVLSGGHPTI